MVFGDADGVSGVGRASTRDPSTGEDRITGFRRLVCRIGESLRDGRRHLEPIARHDGTRIGERGWIGHGGAGADHRRVIPGHVGNADGDQRRRRRALGKPAAFDAGEMLANGVDLDDRGTGGKKRTRHRLLLGERKAGSGSDPVC